MEIDTGLEALSSGRGLVFEAHRSECELLEKLSILSDDMMLRFRISIKPEPRSSNC
jgi:hypothetical protein